MQARFIKDTRAELGLTQSEFAQLVGAHSISVSRWERAAHIAQPTAFQAALIEKFWQAAAVVNDDASRTWSEILAADGAMFTLMVLLDQAWENNGP